MFHDRVYSQLSLLFFFQYYVIITECNDCSFITTRNMAYDTSFSMSLPCGNTYNFRVKAVTVSGFSADSQIILSIKPGAGPVTNLNVKFIPGNNGTNETDFTRLFDEFLLTWDPPEDLKNAIASIKVGANL